VQEAILVDVWNRTVNVNAVNFYQLEDNVPCQEMGAEFAIGFSIKFDPSCRDISPDVLCGASLNYVLVR
jgi:hypothetical protein